MSTRADSPRPTATPAAVDPDAIAIVGMAGRFPGARNVEELWEKLRDGVESIVRRSPEELREAGVPEERIDDPDYVPASAALDDPERFDASFFGYLPREAELMDPQHRHFLECAWEVLESAGYDSARHPGRIGVFGGVARNTYLLEILRRDGSYLDRVGEYEGLITGEKDFPATRVAYKLDLRGPCLNVQTACSTSGVAIHLACQSLLTGECDLALAGGGRILVPQGQGYLYEKGGILSPDGRCRAFDAEARGTVRGSGMAFVALKRLEDALDDRDFIHAVIKGTAVNNDGADKVGFTAPGVRGQSEVIAEALAVARVDAESIGYVEAHGTATPVGDPIEISALTRAFRETTDRTGYCAIGSVKTNLGHLDAGAAVTGLIKAALALRNEEIPPSLHYRRPNPQIDFDNSPFFVNAELRSWPRSDAPRRAGVSSFGLGGTNFHAVVEEAPRRSPADAPEGRPELLVVSARTDEARDAAVRRLADHLDTHGEQPLSDVAFTLQKGRRAFGRRSFAVARDHGEASALLRGGGEARFRGAAEARGEEGTVVFMFPGGGSQHVGMGRELYRGEPVYREELDRCLEALAPEIAEPVRRLLLDADPASEEEGRLLERPSLALPALVSTEIALARLLASWGVEPAAVIGHSVGEYAAATVAEVLSPEDALAVVTLRGRLFEELPRGAMSAVPLPAAEVAAMDIPDLSVAAENQPSTCVASGTVEAIGRLEERLAEEGLEGRRLHIDVAAHSSLVETILEPFREFLETVELRSPRIPLLSNVTGGWAGRTDADDLTDPDYWVRHLRQTVRFAPSLEVLFDWGPTGLLEVGPGRTLASFARMHPGREGRPVAPAMRHPTEDLNDRSVLLAALGTHWIHGLELDWERIRGSAEAGRVPLPTYPFQGERHWAEVLSRPPAQRSEGTASEAFRKTAGNETEAPADSRREAPAGVGEEVPGRSGEMVRAGAAEEAPGGTPQEAPGGEGPPDPGIVPEPARSTIEEIIEAQMQTMHRQLQLLASPRDGPG